jgi:hypothetical protein
MQMKLFYFVVEYGKGKAPTGNNEYTEDIDNRIKPTSPYLHIHYHNIVLSRT